MINKNNIVLWLLTTYCWKNSVSAGISRVYLSIFLPITRILCLFWVTLLLCQYASAKYSIGEAFYLPDSDLLGTFTEGASIFQEIPKECIKYHNQSKTRNDRSFYENVESFYKSVAVSASISPDVTGPFTMGVTLSSASKSMSSGSVNVTGTSINLHTLKDYYRISKDCLNKEKFSKEFEEDFERLPTTIEDPSERSDWGDYNTFLKKYGSHILTAVHRGSRMVQWTFAKESKKYSEKDLALASCIKIANVPAQAALLSMNACGNYSKEDIQRGSEMSTSNKLTLLGGTIETRSKLQQTRTPELIVQFMREAETHPSPAIYKFTSIWNVLKRRYIGQRQEPLVRALNLQAYYEGMLDFGCTRQVRGKVVLRQFVLTSAPTSQPHYECRVPPPGCQTDSDCHYQWVRCYCYGASCVDSRELYDSSSKIKEERFIRKSKSGSFYKEGINNSCYHTLEGCKCNTNWEESWKTIWPADQKISDEDFLWDVHEKFLKRGKSSRTIPVSGCLSLGCFLTYANPYSHKKNRLYRKENVSSSKEQCF